MRGDAPQRGGQRVDVAWTGEGERAAHRGRRTGTEREHDVVVEQHGVVAGDEAASPGVDPRDGVLPQAHAQRRRDALEVEARDPSHAERLGDRERRVDEGRIGREELELEPLAGQRVQREERLESADAATADHDAAAVGIAVGYACSRRHER